MLKRAICDYLGYLNWENVKKVHSNFNSWWMYIYMLTLFPIIMDVDENGGLGIYYAVIIPILFGIMTLTIVPIKLPKQMFLCPMQEKERKKYVHELFAVRLLVPLILEIIGSTIAIGSEKVSPLMMAEEVFALISLMLCCSITSWEGCVWSREENGKVKRVKDERVKGLYTINILGMCISLFVFIINIVMIDDTVTIVFGIFMGFVAGIMLILDILVLRYYPIIVEFSTDYERTIGFEEGSLIR